MKKLLLNKKFIIISVVILIVIIASVVITMTFWNGGKSPNANIAFYGFSQEIDMSEYLPAENIKKIIDEVDGYCFDIKGKKYYHNGEFHDIIGAPVNVENDDVVFDGAFVSEVFDVDISEEKINAKEASSLVKKEFVIYENKMVIFANDAGYIDTFNSYYSLEMMSMLLRNANEQDIKNAFIDLPYSISNNENFMMNYSDPDLELGLQTTLYDMQANGETVVSKGPRIVAGEGEHKDNHTIVRVFNEFQAKTAQFSAYPGNVRGGVKVAGANVPCGDSVRDLIVTAAYNGKYDESKSVRIFDEYGTLYMEITPEFANLAPYNILVGNFHGDKNDELIIFTSKTDEKGDIRYAVYSLSEPKMISDGVINCGAGTVNLDCQISAFYGDTYDSVIIYFIEPNKAFLCDISKNNVTSDIGFELPIDANGVYSSSHDNEGYVITLDENIHVGSSQSFIKFFDDGDIFGNTIEVGAYENLFFWDCNNLENLDESFNLESLYDSEHVKRARYLQIRTDLRSRIYSKIKNNIADEGTSYDDWCADFFESKLYNLSYNVWSPCFSNRWSNDSALYTLGNITDVNGEYIYSVINKDNSKANVSDDSSLLLGTYAEGLIELDKLRIYPLRSYLDELAICFRNDPEKTVAVEPVHDVELSIDGSVGDYNKKMIEGFKEYMLYKYGSIEKINNKFGTSFENEAYFDAPRNGALGDRGEWDLYEGPYFEQWCLYIRQMINKRIAEAYREALLAGFPPEIISSHLTVDADVLPLKNNDSYIIAPADSLMTIGCSYGGAKYGVWFNDDNNFIYLAKNSGFNNTTLSKYASFTDNFDYAKNQLQYLYRNGVKFVNILALSDIGVEADLQAISSIIKGNTVRDGNSGGTRGSVPVSVDGKAYNIIQLGHGRDQMTVLKSVNNDGTWEGSVYLTPFHSHIEVELFDFGTEPREFFSENVLTDLNSGDIVEINFIGAYKGKDKAKLHIDVYEDNVLNKTLSSTFTLSSEEDVIHYVISNQRSMGRVNIKAWIECDEYNDVVVKSFDGNVQRESVARSYFNDTTATPHKGGVTFDILSKECLYK